MTALPKGSAASPAPETVPYIYKIVSASSPPPASLPEVLPLSTLDISSGYIHASVSSQLLGTLNNFFKAESHVYILRIPFSRVRDVVKWEDSAGLPPEKACWDATVPGGAGLFPHLYNGMKLGSTEVDEVGVWKRDAERWTPKGWPFGDIDVPKPS